MNLIVIFALMVARVVALYTNETTSCSYSDTCSVSGYSGVCVSISAGCCSSGTVTSNLCPGSSDIRCCTKASCSTSSGSGTCMQTSLCSSKGGKSIAGYCVGPSDLQCCISGSSGGISRSTVMSRAKVWVADQVPYSQSDYYMGYRQDCSGYVSYCWETGTSYVTQDFPSICTKISKSELQAGDAILAPDHHVLLFGGWIDSDNFYEYAEHDWGDVCRESTGSYSYFINNGYYACRYNNIGN